MFHRDVDDVASRKSRPTPAQAKAHAWVERHHRRRTLSLSDKSDASDRIDVASAKGVQEQVNAELLAGVISLETPGAGKTDKPDISACDIIHAEPILMENYAVDDDDQLQAQVRSCTLDDVHEMKVGVGVFSKEDMQLLSQMFHAQLRTSPEGNPGEDASYGVSKLMHRESFVDILCRFLGSDVHREPRSYASRLFDSFTYVDGTVGTGSGLQFEQFVKGLAAMDPHAPDTSDRLRYVFRVYASSNDDTSPAVLWFNDFKCMLRDILTAMGNLPCEDLDNNDGGAMVSETTNSSVHEQAAALFMQSGLTLEAGFITESVFVAACLNGSFQGPGVLMRLKQRATVLYLTMTRLVDEPGTAHMDILPLADDTKVDQAERLHTAHEVTCSAGGVESAARESSTSPDRMPSPSPPRYQVSMAPDVTFDALASGPHPTEALRKIAELRLTPNKKSPCHWGEDAAGESLQTPVAEQPLPMAVLSPHPPAGTPPPNGPDHTTPPQHTATADGVPLDEEREGASPDGGQPPQQSGPSPPPAPELVARVQARAARVLDTVLHPNFDPPPQQLFGFPAFSLLTAAELSELFTVAAHVVLGDAMVVPCRAPARIFGDIHGQLPDLLHFFHTFGLPHHRSGDVHLINYVFVGDFVDRGSYSLEVLVTLLCLKTCYPANVFLIRGNHEDREMNEHFGFLSECLARVRGGSGDVVWAGANAVFDNLPVAALLENKILCVHGGIGATFEKVEQLVDIPRPLPYPVRGQHAQLMRDVLWSDPTANDEVLGLRCNLRGEDMVEFGPDRVLAFLERNQLDLIVRAHQCVQRGYEFFAGQHLITVFSATNYCGRHDNDGAILSVSRDLNVNFHVITHRERRRFSLWAQPQNSTPPQTRRRPPEEYG
eukprot:m.299673 g.299673  ORF g.299673 m.299673 type:complete len:887 (+) comp20117_c0_seq2:448-3108(+)